VTSDIICEPKGGASPKQKKKEIACLTNKQAQSRTSEKKEIQLKNSKTEKARKKNAHCGSINRLNTEGPGLKERLQKTNR